MRKQIAAANWKMNLKYENALQLLDEISAAKIALTDHQSAVFAVPFPYLEMAKTKITQHDGFAVSAQNCHHQKSGAFTGEVSAEMLQSMQVPYCIVGHSERREYNGETNEMLAAKLDPCIDHSIIPVFCCGEPLEIRENGSQNGFVEKQLNESLFHLDGSIIKTIVIAYEPIWAIGTGKTASTAQAQEMHRFLRSVLAARYGKELADEVSILYGGSVKAGNAKELFACDDVDGGLVGGASLVAADFIEIIKALK